MPKRKYIDHDEVINALIGQAASIKADQLFYLLTMNGLFLNKQFNFDINAHESKTGLTPLMVACHDQHPNIHLATLLLEMGANANQPNDRNETPLYRAILSGSLDLVRTLVIYGAKLQYMGVDYVQLANDHYFTEIADYLDYKMKLEKKDCELISYEDSRTRLALIERQLKLAVEKNKLNEVKVILDQHTIDFSRIRFEGGYGCSWLATINGQLKMVQLLLEHGDAAFFSLNEATLLEAAKAVGHPEIASYLEGVQEQRYKVLLAAFENQCGKNFVTNYLEAQRRRQLGFFQKASLSLKDVFSTSKSSQGIQRGLSR